MNAPLSPFLSGTNIQYAWDSTCLGLFKTCPRLYQYQMIQGWAPKDNNIHLYFGQEFHHALEQYAHIKATLDSAHDEILHVVVKDLLERTHGWEVDQDTKAGKYKNRYSLIEAVINYLDHYKDDPAETFILENGKAAVELSFRFELDWGPKNEPIPEDVVQDDGSLIEYKTAQRQPYLLCGHLDRVVTYADALMVMDHKTTITTLSSYYFNQYQPNNQMTLYTLASKVILDTPVKGVIIDGIQLLLEDTTKFQRGFTYRTEDQLQEWLVDLKILLTFAESCATMDYWPMNDTACDKFGGCKFRDICSKSPQVRERFLAADFVKLPLEERWNPLKPR